MKKLNRIEIIRHLQVFIIVVFLCDSAFAYVDPGVGSFFWQIILAGFFGGLFYLRRAVKIVLTRAIDTLGLRPKNGKQD